MSQTPAEHGPSGATPSSAAPGGDQATGPGSSPGSTGLEVGGAPAKGGKTAAPGKRDDPLRASRTSGFYTAVVALGVVLVLLIIFIVQNTGKAPVTFLWMEGSAPQAVLLLIALAAGIFLTATGASLRLLQVRRRVKKERKARA